MKKNKEQEMNETMEEVQELYDKLSDVLNGFQINTGISAVLCLIASLVMSIDKDEREKTITRIFGALTAKVMLYTFLEEEGDDEHEDEDEHTIQ